MVTHVSEVLPPDGPVSLPVTAPCREKRPCVREGGKRQETTKVKGSVSSGSVSAPDLGPGPDGLQDQVAPAELGGPVQDVLVLERREPLAVLVSVLYVPERVLVDCNR